MSIRVAETKVLISCVVTAKLICAFVFAYADSWFSYAAAHLIKLNFKINLNPRVNLTIDSQVSRKTFEPHREKTGFLPRRKQRRRTASR